MSLPAIVIETEALGLSRTERSRLATRLLDSLDERAAGDPAATEKAWVEEAARRYEAHLRGDDPAIPAEEIFADLRKGLD